MKPGKWVLCELEDDGTHTFVSFASNRKVDGSVDRAARYRTKQVALNIKKLFEMRATFIPRELPEWLR